LYTGLKVSGASPDVCVCVYIYVESARARKSTLERKPLNPEEREKVLLCSRESVLALDKKTLKPPERENAPKP